MGTMASMRWTRAVSILATLLLLAVNAFALLAAADGFQTYLSGVTLALGLVALVAILVRREPKGVVGPAAAEAVRPPSPSRELVEARKEIERLRKRVGELVAVKPRAEKRQAHSERSKAAHAGQGQAGDRVMTTARTLFLLLLLLLLGTAAWPAQAGV